MQEDTESVSQFPIKFLTATIILTGLVLLWFGWNAYHSPRLFKTAQELAFKIERLRGDIVHLDEVLTMSARMAAVTGNLEWEKRYRSFESQLDAAIKEAIRLAPEAQSREDAAQTDDANMKLVAMENRSFDLIRQDHRGEAQAVLFSQEYETQKQIYAKGIAQFTIRLKDITNSTLQSQSTVAFFPISTIIIIVPGFLFSWLLVLRMIRRWQTILSEMNQQLKQRADELAELNFSLDQKVKERTKELESSRETALNMMREAEESRKKAEQAKEELRQSQEHSRLIIETANDAFVSIDANGVIIDWNNQAAATFGWSRSEVLGCTLTDTIIPERYREAHRKGLQHFMTTGQGPVLGKTVELAALRRDGQELLVEITIWPIRVKDTYQFNSFVRDITERKNAEKEVKNSAYQFKTVIDSVGDGITFSNEKGHFSVYSSRMKEITGYTIEEANACGDFTRLLYPDPHEHKEALERLNKTVDNHLPEGIETTIQSKDGSKKKLLVSTLKMEYQNTTMFLSVYRDITARKQAEEQVRKLSRAVEQSPSAVIITDPTGKIEYVNLKFLQITGYTTEEVIGQTPRILKSGETSLKEYKELWDTITNGNEWRGVFHNRKKNGELFWASAAISPIRDQNGSIAYYLGVEEDITVQKEIENELRIANRNLAANENTLRSMLDDLKRTHQELKNAQSQLLQNEKLVAIGQLAAGIAHEINNPVGFISSNLEVLNKYIDSYSEILRAAENLKMAVKDNDMAKAKTIVFEMITLEEKVNLNFITTDIDQLLRESESGVERIKKIVTDLRNFAHTEKDVMDFSNIEDVLDSVINIVYNEIKYKAELKKEYGKLPFLRCNAQRLGQVFINILINAVQAIKDKGIIEIKTFIKDGYAYIEIADTGMGIPRENLSKIFDPFFTTKPLGKGTGLGLSISYDIVKKHNGDIKVESEVGKGSKFTIRLPLEV